ncbi:M23 family metallopeptidase [Saccharomonospora piscinae]|uniref:M23 family metallopeptidase n=1 Tax=Saccharomonospora piscinae TaxID=687388 RepID=UPI0009BF6EBA|nr:M23 family metallopeptidase [Saccharomonospora piscinae]
MSPIARRPAPPAWIALACALVLASWLPLPAPATAVPSAPSAPSAQSGPPPAASPPRFGWPLPGTPTVARPFERPASTYAPGHRGVDLTASPGGDVLASGEGLVVFAGPVGGRGVVSIDHDGGLRTTYEPLRWEVHAGQRVHRGEVIGTVEPGHAPCPAEACLHWGVRRGPDYLDPLRLVATGSALRLKPWDARSPPNARTRSGARVLDKLRAQPQDGPRVQLADP